ncbi:MAG: GatB/YqeY domain-containing protein [Gemmatimonadaceae bacterium]
MTSSELLTRLQRDMNASRKAQDKPATLLLGTVLADAKNRRIELQRDLTDDDVLEVLRKGVKRRRESIEMYDKGGRKDLSDRESAEVAIIERYLPAQTSDDDIRAAVKSAIAEGSVNIGAVMGRVLPQLKGKAEGSRISAIAREELSKQA